MKFRWDNNKWTARTVSYCIAVFWGILLYFVFGHAADILEKVAWFLSLITPFFIGFALAYFLNPLVVFIESRLLRFAGLDRKRQKFKRRISICICIFLTLLLFAFLFFMLIPQLIGNLVALFNNLPEYADQFAAFVKNLFGRFHIDSGYVQSIALTSDRFISMAANAFSNVLPTVVSYSAKVASFVVNLIVGMVISIYFLSSKELFAAQVKKFLYALLPAGKADRLIEIGQLTHRTFLRFIVGKMTDCLAVGILCLAGLALLDIPNALLLAVIIGLANFIPFLGPYLGAILSTILVLLTAPGKILWFWVCIFIIQQLDGNVIDPRISGKSTGIPAVWAIFAIFLGGGLFGIVGMLVAVPVFAVFFVLFKHYVERRLERKGMPTKTEEYYRKGKMKPEEDE